MRKRSIITKLCMTALIPLVIGCGNGMVTNEDHDYSLTITDMRGQVLKDVEVSLSAKGARPVSGKTDKEGKITLTGNAKEYTVNLDNLPEGFYWEGQSASIKADQEGIVKVPSTVISKEAPRGKYYQPGDLMYDCYGLDADGEKVWLSELLKDRDAVMLNFWYITCSACQYEFPFLAYAYEDLGKDIAIMALDPFDDEYSIAQYKKNMGYTFDMLYDDKNISDRFNVDGYPTSVIIDRYGFVSYWARGAFGSEYEVRTTWNTFIGPDYEPKFYTEDDVQEKPSIKQPLSEEMVELVGGEGFNGTFRPEDNPNDAEMSWPWVIDDDKKAIKPSNKGKPQSFSIVYIDIEIKEDEVIAFDYYCSTEQGGDLWYIFVDNLNMYEISGEYNRWQTMYCYVPQAGDGGKHTLAFLYLKDTMNDAGEDTIYVRDMRILPASSIKSPTYMYRPCSYGEVDLTTRKWEYYETPVYNEQDGYYHVGTANGPLVLSSWTGVTHWDNQKTFYTYAVEGAFTFKDADYYDIFTQFANYAVNNTYNLSPVTKDLKDAIQDAMTRVTGVQNENQWLEICYYYATFGGAKNIQSPIHNLAPFDCDEAKVGNNSVTFHTLVMPRGMIEKFVAPESAVYCFRGTSRAETDCWLEQYASNGTMRRAIEGDKLARHYFVGDYDGNYELYAYLEKGSEWYIRSAFYDPYQMGELTYNIKNVGQSVDVLKLCAEGVYSGTDEGNLTTSQIRTKIGDDGFYHSVNSDGSLGGLIYAEFKYLTDFAVNRSLLECTEYGLWGKTKDEDENGFGDAQMQKDMEDYCKKMITSGECEGLVPVDAKLQGYLQRFVGYFGYDIPGAWQKMCYYYQHIGK